MPRGATPAREAPSVWVEVDLERVRRNVERLRSLLGRQTKLLAVVKANGYGHGDVEVARAAIAGSADWLGVARVGEGHALRSAGISHPILLLAEPPLDAIARAVELELVPTVYTQAAAERLSQAAVASGRSVPVHVKVDTGMHRYGVLPQDLGSFFDAVAASPGLEVRGLWSHFAVAEDVLNPYTMRQHETFLQAVESLGPRAEGLLLHLANSAGTISFPGSHLGMVRCGISVYGIPPSPALSGKIALEPALSMKAVVGLVKRLAAGEPVSYGQRFKMPASGFLATIPAGYADGISRRQTNSGQVLIRGRRYAMAGAVTMDHIMVCLGDDGAEPGDEVVLIGRQGEEEITAQEVADCLGTIPYEVVCAIGARVPRYYSGAS